MTTIYAKRENIFEKGEQEWRVEPDCLIWTRPNGESLTVLWPDVTGLRAAFAPTKWKTWRHLLEIQTRQGRHLFIDNAHFRGVGDFEDRSLPFKAFALACIQRIAVQAPDARGWIGASPGTYAAQLVFMVAMMLLLLFMLIALPTPLGAIMILKLVLIVVSLPVAVLWAIRARPRPAAMTEGGFEGGLPKVNSHG